MNDDRTRRTRRYGERVQRCPVPHCQEALPCGCSVAVQLTAQAEQYECEFAREVDYLRGLLVDQLIAQGSA